MGYSVLYIPASETTDQQMWEKIRGWQKDKGLSWERLRVTPDFYSPLVVNRDEMQGMLELVRQGLVDRVVYMSLSEEQERDLDWLAFVFSLQKYQVSVETSAGGALDISKKMQQLTSSFHSIQAPQ